MSRNNNRRIFLGFALPELLLGLVIAGVGIFVTVTSYIMVNQMWQDDLVTNELSRNANIGIEKMLHGTSENAGLLAAKEILTPITGATQDFVTFTDSNDVSRGFYYSSGNISTENSTVILSDVDGVAFYNNGQTLLINLALQKKAGSKEINLLVQTHVSPRN